MHEKEAATHRVSIVNTTRGVEVFSAISQGNLRQEIPDGHYKDFTAAEKAKKRLENGWMFLESVQVATFMMTTLAAIRSLTLPLEPQVNSGLAVTFLTAAGVSVNLVLRTGRERERNQHELTAIHQAGLYKRPQYDQEFEI